MGRWAGGWRHNSCCARGFFFPPPPLVSSNVAVFCLSLQVFYFCRPQPNRGWTACPGSESTKPGCGAVQFVSTIRIRFASRKLQVAAP